MRTLDGHDSGVIDAPAATPAATAPPAEPLLAPAVQQGPIQNVPLGQLPADVAPPEPPAFTLSRKESEDGGLPPLGAPHAPALGGGAPDASAIQPAGFADPASPLLGAAHGTIDNAGAALGADAQGLLEKLTTAELLPVCVKTPVPVHVLNNSTVAGLAARTAGQLSAEGWSIAETGNYPGGVIPKTTVY
ncbi:LytR C-terminal domain-containing protein, partial [Nocardia wallacei]|uniref:LytR C-terminal domain-containing protein n=1 Tax=Nocardia wallacei TaxID=480035 RepID=UPI002457A317